MRRPNIVFIFSDQQHWKAAGFMDNSFYSPNLDKLAGVSTVFTNAFCTTPQCSPSRSSIVTGFYPSKTEVLGNMGAAGGNPLHMQTIGRLLQEEGYTTAYFGKWHLGKDRNGTAGWDEDFGVTGPETTDDLAVTGYAVDFIERKASAERPFALFLSYNNPHDIYMFKRDSDLSETPENELPNTWGKKDFSTVPDVQQQFMKEDQGSFIFGENLKLWQKYRDFYREKVKLYDSRVGVVLDTLRKTELFDEAVVFCTSDHGDMDCNLSLIFKGPFMYEHMIRVPFFVKMPKQTKQYVSDFNTVNVDIVPTILDIVADKKLKCDGVSLKPILKKEGTEPVREFVMGEYYSKQQWVNPIRMIRTNNYKYTYYLKNGEELYDLTCDSDELINLMPHKKADMFRNKLMTWLENRNDPFLSYERTNRAGEILTDR